MKTYSKALKLLKKGNELIDVTIKLIKSAAIDIYDIQTIQLMIRHEILKREIDMKCGNFTPEDIIGRR